MRILITGSRDWTDHVAIQKAITTHTLGQSKWRTTIVHGACPTGADLLAAEFALNEGFRVESYSADWSTHGRAAGPIRNQQMVDLGADICLAFPLGESRGTRHCMQAAEKAGIEVINYGD